MKFVYFVISDPDPGSSRMIK